MDSPQPLKEMHFWLLLSSVFRSGPVLLLNESLCVFLLSGFRLEGLEDRREAVISQAGFIKGFICLCVFVV